MIKYISTNEKSLALSFKQALLQGQAPDKGLYMPDKIPTISKEMILNYAVVYGMIKLVLYDERENSSTKGEVQEIFMGWDNYCLVKIPPLVWNGFKGIGTTPAIVANLATIPHRADEIERLDPLNNHIPYKWELKHR